MREWVPTCDDYLSELMRLEGRGDADVGTCPGCGGKNGQPPLYRCISNCFSCALVCEKCCRTRHQDRPLDIIEVCLSMISYVFWTLKMRIEMERHFFRTYPTTRHRSNHTTRSSAHMRMSQPKIGQEFHGHPHERNSPRHTAVL